MATPGPAQRAISNIIRLSFSSGGLVFVRMEQVWSSISPLPSHQVEVSWPDMPTWNKFQLFDFEGEKDPSVDQAARPPIVDPVTNEMLGYYRYWPPKPSKVETTFDSVPGEDTWIIDKAHYYATINGFDNGQVGYGEQQFVEDLLYRRWFEVYGEPARDKFSSHLSPYFDGSNFFDTPAPPSPIFFEIAANAQPPWEYHSEPSPPKNVFTKIATAILIINVTKALKSLPEDSVTKKKPSKFKFRIELPSTGGAKLSWRVQASADTTRVSKPPKPDDGRRTFPVGDKGKLRLVPQWDDFPDADIGGINQTISNGSFVIGTVTFATKDDDLKVELQDSISSGGEIG